MNNRKCLLRAGAASSVNEYLESVWPQARRLFTGLYTRARALARGSWSSRDESAVAISPPVMAIVPSRFRAGGREETAATAGNRNPVDKRRMPAGKSQIVDHLLAQMQEFAIALRFRACTLLRNFAR